MAEDNFVENDLYAVNDMENVEDADDDFVENDPSVVNDMENLEDADDDFVENDPSVVNDMENLEDADDAFVENDPSVVNDMDNLEDAEDNFVEDDLSVGNDMENVEDAYDLEIMDTVNVELLENLGNSENEDFVKTSENVGDLENVENLESVENLETVTDVIEDSHPENDSERKEEKKWPGWPGENVFRMLVPVKSVGGIIGRKGEFIKKICEETKSRIKILDGLPGTSERAVLVSATEEPDLPISPAMEGLLTIHKRMINGDVDPANVTLSGTVCTRLLVAAAQAGNLIGKQGSTVKSIQDASSCIVRVLGGEHLPVFALPDDSVVEVQGESSGVHKAIELILSHLRKFLVDRSIVGVFETQMQKPDARAQNMHPQHWGGPQGFPAAGGGPGYIPSPQYMHPPHPFDTYYPPRDTARMDKPPRQGPFSRGRDPSMRGHVTNGQPHQSMVTKVTQNMQIPLLYAEAVIGTAGSNISFIRRSSGATIAVQETRGVPGEMTVEITGSASQVQAAQQSIQTCIAEAANNVQNPVGGPPSQGHNSYPSQGPLYGSAAPDSTGHAPSGDYESAMYGSNYGY